MKENQYQLYLGLITPYALLLITDAQDMYDNLSQSIIY